MDFDSSYDTIQISNYQIRTPKLQDIWFKNQPFPILLSSTAQIPTTNNITDSTNYASSIDYSLYDKTISTHLPTSTTLQSLAKEYYDLIRSVFPSIATLQVGLSTRKMLQLAHIELLYPSDQMSIKGIRVNCVIGCSPKERHQLQPLEISITTTYNSKFRQLHDKITDHCN